MSDFRGQPRDAWRNVQSAREDFFAFQEALIELAMPSGAQTLESGRKQDLALQLTEQMGQLDISEHQAVEIFNAADALLSRLEEITTSRPEATSIEVLELVSAEVSNLRQMYLSAGINDDLLAMGISLYKKLVKKTHPRSELMLESLLISAVSSYESLVSSLISASLNFNPSQMDKYDKLFKYSDIVTFPQMADFIQDAAEKFTDSLMSEPMEKWLGFLKVAVRQDLAWIGQELNEVLQRRHVLVHNGGIVSKRYLENVPETSNRPRLNEKLSVSSEYLRQALDKMAETVLFLSQAALFAIHESKAAKNLGVLDDDYYGGIYDLLVDGRYGAIANVYEKLAPIMWTATNSEQLRVNCWQAKKSLVGIEAIRFEVEKWDVSLSKLMQLAKYALLEDLPKAKGLLLELQKTGEVTVIDAATWPILEPLRRAAPIGPIE